jgi:hypothetical protein
MLVCLDRLPINNVKMANGEELVVGGEDARRLLSHVEKNMLRPT